MTRLILKISKNQYGFENESIKIKTQINKLYENLYLFENEKLSYNLILFNDNFLLLININDQTYDKLEKVSNTQVFFIKKKRYTL